MKTARGIGWNGITWSVPTPEGMSRRIVSDCSGYVTGGEVLAIMGPSGCGKTSLLDILANRTGSGSLAGWACFSDEESADGSMYFNYVPQEDSLLGSFTVFETLQYAYQLGPRFDSGIEEQTKAIDKAINDLGLDVCRHTRVGDIFSKGISGGQKRRLSLAVALLSEPKGLLLDEPTSGLDSASALGVVQALRNVAAEYGIPVIATIHQPSSEVWAIFDKVCLLTKGRMVYFGAASTSPEYFAQLGHRCPPLSNPADFFLALINQDFDGHADVEALVENFTSSETYKNLIARIEDGKKFRTLAFGEECGTVQTRSGPPRHLQFTTLLRRNILYSARNPGVILIRLVMYGMLAVLMGMMFWNNGAKTTDAAIQARISSLFFIFAFMVFMSISVLPFYIQDKAVYDRERMNKDYELLPFVLAQFFSTVPGIFLIALVSAAITVSMMSLTNFGIFLTLLFVSLLIAEGFMALVALLVPQFIIGIAAAAGVYGMFMLFEGFFQVKSEIPGYLVWIYYTGFHTYSFRSAMYNEFNGAGDFKDAISPTLQSGEAVLESYDMDDVDVASDIAVLLANVLAFQLLVYTVLKTRSTKR